MAIRRPLSLAKTKVDKAGVDALATALPDCRIEWDGGIVEGRSPADPDRAGAEYILSIGGGGMIHEIESKREHSLHEIKILPNAKFQLTSINLDTPTATRMASDSGMSAFKGCRNLGEIRINGTKITAKGFRYLTTNTRVTHMLLNYKTDASVLAEFPELSKLSYLSGARFDDDSMTVLDKMPAISILQITGGPFTENGWKRMATCRKLTELNLEDLKLTNESLSFIENCKLLETLRLKGTSIGNDGLRYLKVLPSLKTLSLTNTLVSDDGIAHLEDLVSLKSLELIGTRITNRAMSSVASLSNLDILDLGGTAIDDQGLMQISLLQKMSRLTITHTKVTQAGVDKLKTALPGCKIEWNGGVIEPTKK